MTEFNTILSSAACLRFRTSIRTKSLASQERNHAKRNRLLALSSPIFFAIDLQIRKNLN